MNFFFLVERLKTSHSETLDDSTPLKSFPFLFSSVFIFMIPRQSERIFHIFPVYAHTINIYIHLLLDNVNFTKFSSSRRSADTVNSCKGIFVKLFVSLYIFHFSAWLIKWEKEIISRHTSEQAEKRWIVRSWKTPEPFVSQHREKSKVVCVRGAQLKKSRLYLLRQLKSLSICCWKISDSLAQ